MLSKIEGKKHSDIAAILGISQKTVEKRIYAALKKIKEAIKK
jgi:RNA polymerase sigma-70 factor (ECF subfamily)